jgi:Flp pilus assembly protein TadG
MKRITPLRRKARGAASLEFAALLPVLILMMYAMIMYALLFAAQQTLVLAASEGARAALRFGTTAEREVAACQVATSTLSWIAATSGAAPACAVTTDCPHAPCRRVRVTYDYLSHPLVPTLPLMSGMLPDTLQSDAIVHFTP